MTDRRGRAAAGRTDRWLVTGASGRLGYHLCRLLAKAGHEVTGTRLSHAVGLAGVSEHPLDLTDGEAVADFVAALRPDVIVHTAGLTNVDECEADPDAAMLLNAETTRTLAMAASERRARFVYISTDQLWRGTTPMTGEDVPPDPLNAYGLSKAAGEKATLNIDPNSLVIRTNFFGDGPAGRPTFSDWILDGLAQRRTLTLFHDVYFTPIELGQLCRHLVDAVDRGAHGIFHLVGAERLSKHDFGLRLARRAGADTTLIQRTSIEEARLTAPRPRDMSLATGKISRFLGTSMPDVDSGLARLRRCQAAKHALT